MADNTNNPGTPSNFAYVPASGQTVGTTNAAPRSDYAQRMMPVPGVVYGNMPGLTPGMPVVTSELAGGASKQ